MPHAAGAKPLQNTDPNLATVAVAIAASWLFCGPALPQEDFLNLPSGYAEEYEATLEDPGDLDSMYALARRAETEALATGSEGLFRLAILLYERMRLVESGLTEVSLRLGEINFRRGNYVEARTHFERALEDPRLPPEMARDATGYIDAIDRELAPSALSGSVIAGLRYQTNAGLREDDQGSPAESDFDAHVALDLRHRLDPGWQRGHTIETTVSAYAIQQFELVEASSFGAALTFGPRFRLDTYGWGGASVRPFLAAGFTGFDYDLYKGVAGGGLEAELPLHHRLTALASLSAVYEWHGDIGQSFVDLDGPDYRLRFTARYRPAPRLLVDATLGVRRDIADSSSESFWRYDGELAGRLGFAGPFGLGAGDWTAAAVVGYGIADYRLGENEYFWSRLSADVPVTPALSLIGSLGYSGREADVLNDDDYENWEVALGLAHRF